VSADIKTPEQIKIALAAIRLHGHILAWTFGFIVGFALWFWFGLSPRPQVQAGIFYDLVASFMRWLGALSWFPRLGAVYIQDAGVSLWSYLIPCLIAGFIAAAAALLSRLWLLAHLRHKAFTPRPDKIIRGANTSPQSVQSKLDQME
jgi:lipopolysaccharide export LptBFGC system permease protein LptF